MPPYCDAIYLWSDDVGRRQIGTGSHTQYDRTVAGMYMIGISYIDSHSWYIATRLHS